MKLLSIVTLFLLAACVDYSEPEKRGMRPICSADDDRERLADFILACVKNGNPMSDEEGEDLVRQCERTGENVVCPTVAACYHSGSFSWAQCAEPTPVEVAK